MNLRVTLAAAVAIASVVAVSQQLRDDRGQAATTVGEADYALYALQLGQAPTTAAVELAPISTPKVGIIGDGVLVYKRPDSTSPTLASVSQGKTAWVKGRTGNWYKLKFLSGLVGYVDRASLAPIGPVVEAKAKEALVVKSGAVIRKGSSTKTAKLAKIGVGKTVKVLGKAGKWLKIETSNGLVGFVFADLVKTDIQLAADRARNWRSPSYADEIPTGGALDIIAEAKKHLGTPYVWGGTTTRGFDCSGFVRYVYRQAEGINLPRTSREQAKFGMLVSKDDIQPGDILSFASRGGTRVNHSGIYIGDGKFIHASSGGGRVRIDNLAGYYRKRLITVHRPVRT
jgi:cell wall-associated NlpC family hydrolase